MANGFEIRNLTLDRKVCVSSISQLFYFNLQNGFFCWRVWFVSILMIFLKVYLIDDSFKWFVVQIKFEIADNHFIPFELFVFTISHATDFLFSTKNKSSL